MKQFLWKLLAKWQNSLVLLKITSKKAKQNKKILTSDYPKNGMIQQIFTAKIVLKFA
jgi:hypothetical protein